MSRSPIAVVGMASLLPGSDDLGTFWESVREARDCFSDVPETHWRIEDYFDPTPRAKDKTYGRRGGFIKPQPFDALGFGMPPSSLQSTDVAQLLALLVSQRCIADADNGRTPRFDRSRTSVILGGAATTQLVAHMSGRLAHPMWREGLRNAGFDEASIERACAAIADQFVPWQESTFPGLLGNVIAGRVANRFDLGGTNCVLDAACASSLAAVAMAVDELRSGRTDTVITGGVDALNDVLMFLCFSQTPALSLSGDCRPFSDEADGTMLGEGVAMLALRRLEDAERDGHLIYALIEGVGTSSDGRAKSVYSPRPEGQSRALERAYADAGFSPATVELIEAHGTGTVAGDAAEVAALRSVFGAADDSRTEWCAVGSVKSQIGHTKAAAGAAGLVKAVLALRHRTLPPTVKVARVNPALGLEGSPFYVNTIARPWFEAESHPRRAGVSSFGFGGSNFHVALEEYRGPAVAPRCATGPHLLLFSAADDSGMLAALRAVAGAVDSDRQLAAFARRAQRDFAPSGGVRLGVVADSHADLPAAIDEAEALLGQPGDVARGTRSMLRRSPPIDAGEVAFLFPGQGSQYVGMGRDLALRFPEAFEVWQRATRRVRDDQRALGDVVFPHPAFDRDAREAQESILRTTAWAQPALAAASLAQLALLERVGLSPRAAAGHSFGELVALHASGAYDAETLLDLARARGEAMAACSADEVGGDAGSMLAVAADVGTVQALLERLGSDVVVANDNHPRQTVLSGPTGSLLSVGAALSDAGLSHQQLPVAAAFHSPLVAPAVDRFAADVSSVAFHPLRVPVVGNGTAQPYEEDVAAVRARLAYQLAHPVRFRESIETLYDMGARVFVEVGAGNVLSGLAAKCLAGRSHLTVPLDRRGEHGVRAWWIALAELSTLGLPLDLASLEPEVPELEDVPARPRGPTVTPVGGANLGKPYPPQAGTAPGPRRRDTIPAAAELSPHAPPAPAASAMATEPLMPFAADRSPELAHDDPAEVLAVSLSDSYEPMDDHSTSLLLEAQRLTQQAILESFAMTLRSLNGDAHAAALSIPMVRGLPSGVPRLDALQTPTAPITRAEVPDISPVRSSNGQPARSNGAAASEPASRPHRQPQPAAPAMSSPTVAAVASPPPAAAAVPAPAGVATAVATPPRAPSGPAVSADVVLEVIAAKTGYPTEALGPELELEADLGIDSIKRVEILAALSDRLPGLDPRSVDPGKVRRVRDLLALLGEGPPQGPG